MKKIDITYLKNIPGLDRTETTSKEEMRGILSDLTHAVYQHEDLYGAYCPIQTYINCPPEKVFAYMQDTLSLEEWSYSLREFAPASEEETRHAPDTAAIYVGYDKIGTNTKIYCKTVANKDALTVDYHCAWDQGFDLWMIYLYRIVPASLVFKKEGSVIFWQNCRHPYYDQNPYPELAPPGRPWVGQFWDLFYAGHTLELANLKAILEYRHANNLPIGPYYTE
jgi:hypothetical protein